MAKTLFFYRMNIYDGSDSEEIRLDKTERAKLIDSYIESLRTERPDRIAISKFTNRKNDKTLYFEVIDDVENGLDGVENSRYVFGMIGQRAGSNYHLREEDTSSSKDLPLQSNQSLEAATFFLLDKRTMVCCFTREKNGPMIEELNGLFSGYKSFGINRIKMLPITKPGVLEEVLDKKFVTKIGYEIEVPTESFFEMIDVDFDESEELEERGYAVLKFELRSTTKAKSLLDELDTEEQKNLLSRIVENARNKIPSSRIKKPGAYTFARNDGESSQEYNFIDEKINLVTTVDFSENKLKSFKDKNPQFVGRMNRFMFIKQQLHTKLRTFIRNGSIPTDR